MIYQDISGKVVLDRLAIPPLYGPFLPPEVQNYPQPPCEPIDAVVEATLHEPDANTPETPDGLAEATAGREQAGLARIAASLGSFFRPKSADAVVKPQDVDLSELVSQAFLIPVEGVDAEKLKDSFLSSRGRHRQHLAIDIGAPRGTPVLATIDGEIVRVDRERLGGKSIYEKDVTGQYLLFYCHLSRYAERCGGRQEGQEGRRDRVRRLDRACHRRVPSPFFDHEASRRLFRLQAGSRDQSLSALPCRGAVAVIRRQ